MRDYALIETDLGWVGVMRSLQGVCATTLPRPTPLDALVELDPTNTDREVTEECLPEIAAALRARSNGLAAQTAPTLDLAGGTPFQQSVWRAVLTISIGETRSYAWIAQEIGNPRAARAVGQAVGRNPLPLLVPCHRVVAADGSLGGFGPGHDALPTKRSLLRREGVHYHGATLEQLRSIER